MACSRVNIKQVIATKQDRQTDKQINPTRLTDKVLFKLVCSDCKPELKIKYLVHSKSGARAVSRSWFPHYQGFTITHRHTKLRRTPLDEWSAPSRNLCLKTHYYKRQTSMTPRGLRTLNTNKRAAADPPVRLHGHGDWHTSKRLKNKKIRGKFNK
jgi:uncharacterized protein YlaI